MFIVKSKLEHISRHSHRNDRNFSVIVLNWAHGHIPGDGGGQDRINLMEILVGSVGTPKNTLIFHIGVRKAL